MGKVLVADNYDFRALAIEAGSADPKEIVWDPDTGMLEVADVTDSALSAAKNRLDTGTATASAEDKAEKILEIADACKLAIENGFESDPKGTGAVWFDSKLEDQVNLVGNILAGGPTAHSSRGTKGGPKVYAAYTNTELLTVLRDGRAMKLTHLQRFNDLKTQALAALTRADLNAITF